MLSTLRAQLPKTPFYPVQSVISFQRMIAFGGPGAAPDGQQNQPSKEKTVPIRHYQPPVSDIIDYTVPDANGKSTPKTTLVQSLMGGAQIFGKISELLSEAEKATEKGQPKPWVMAELYELQNPELYPARKCPPGTPGAEIHHGLLDRIINLHRNNQAEVRMILDHSPQQPRVLEPDPTKPLKEQPKVKIEEFHNERTLKKLQDCKIKVVAYPNEKTLKNHTKIFMLNNKHAVIAGMNWGNHSATNHDAGVYIQGPDVRNIFHQVYKPDWISANGDPKHLPPIKPFHPGKIKVLQTSGKHSEQGARNEVLGEILHQIKNARSSIQAQLFVLTHKEVVSALIKKHQELKAQGKPGVQLLVDEGLANVFPNCQPGIKKLDDAGVPIRLFKEDITNEEKLHAKWAVFDRKKVLMGSANWSSLGLDAKDGGYSYQGGDAALLSDDEDDEGARRIPAKTNHEIAVMIEDAPRVAENFARQADYDFNQPGVPNEKKLSIPVFFRKWDPKKSWKDQRCPNSSWKKPHWRPLPPKESEASAQPAAEGKRNAASVPNESGSPRSKRSKTDVAS